MCGLAGLFIYSEKEYELKKELKSMSDRITHRGPDDSGIWVDKIKHIGFAHRRLSIQDLSPSGHQPMSSATDRYVIAYNGEVYNFLELREELKEQAHRFEGGSDTEVILAAIEAWGLEKALTKFVGMFAFSLWDKSNNTLYLARDRMGEKPLYYGCVEGVFAFSSELKSIKAFSGWQGEVDREALGLLLRHNYIPAPYSIYKNIKKLIPGTYLSISSNGEDLDIAENNYWSLEGVFEEGSKQPHDVSYDEVVKNVETLLTKSIKQQMLSDVPLGAFLSGGIDSSLIVSLMQSASSSPVKTFTIGFKEKNFNEAELAKSVAEHLGTVHTELYVTADDAMNIIPKLAEIYDEPFADSSQIPTFIVSKLAKQEVTVALSGDGGDEVFCGYTRYFKTISEWQKLTASQSKKNYIWRLLSVIPDSVIELSSKCIPGFTGINKASFSQRLKRKVRSNLMTSLQPFYRHSQSYWDRPESVVKASSDPVTFLSGTRIVDKLGVGLKSLMCLDAGSYLPDDILTKVDRAAMNNSLESRIPILDHRLIEYAAGIPEDMLVSGGVGKQVLRSILYKHVPKEMIDRPKVGFAVPIADWLRGPLKVWAESLLNKERLEQEGYFYPSPVRKKWEEHITNQYDWSFYLWGILMFQSWLDAEKRE